MRINYNQSAIIANSVLNKTDKKLSTSVEKLSSGYKINHAKDNPAGLAISHRMDSQIRGIGVASNNTNDGISVVETADGALSEVSAMLQRMSELAVQASNGVKTDDDRKLIDAEIQQLKEEISRISRDTEFNGQPLLDGTFDLKGYTDVDAVKIDYYSDEVVAGDYYADFSGILSLLSTDPVDISVDKSAFTEAGGFPQQDLNAVYENGKITVTAIGNFKMTYDFKYPDTVDTKDPQQVVDFVNGIGNVNMDITGIGAMKIQVGSNEGQELAVRIPEVSLNKMNMEDLNVLTVKDAQKAIEQAKTAMSYISEERARLGAYQNRMEHNTSSLEVSKENMTASYSRIMDVDMAEEMTEYTTQQVLSQAGISMLAQANEAPEQVLQLLS